VEAVNRTPVADRLTFTTAGNTGTTRHVKSMVFVNRANGGDQHALLSVSLRHLVGIVYCRPSSMTSIVKIKFRLVAPERV